MIIGGLLDTVVRLGVAVLLCWSGAASAQCLREVRILAPEDPRYDLRYGVALATNGEVALLGNDRSYVAVSDLASGEIVRVYAPDDVTVTDAFGEALAVHGSTAVIGAAYWDSYAENNTGKAYVYDLDSHQIRYELLPIDHGPYARYGAAVAVNEHHIVVGAIYEHAVGAVYVHDAATGELLQKISPPHDDRRFTNFGSAVAIEDDYLVISAPHEHSPTWQGGALYVYRASTGELIRKHFAPDRGSLLFGREIAIGDGLLYATSFRATAAGHQSAGAVYVFSLETGALITTLVPDDSGPFQEFGFSLALHEGVLVVGAVIDNSAGYRAGAAYVFDVDGLTQRAKLLPSDAQRDARFGDAVAVHGNHVIVGAYSAQHQGERAGQAYQFDVSEHHCPADSNLDGTVDYFDIAHFLGLYDSDDPRADLSLRCGVLDFHDVTAFFDAYASGCP